jgi:hypothetical protein
MKQRGAATRSYGLQPELGRPVHGGAQQRDAVRDPVEHGQPVADVADEVIGDFSPEVPEQAGEAVDANFCECAEDGDEEEEEGQLGAAQEVPQAHEYARAWVAL